MYKLTILTPYNTIYLSVDDVNAPDIKEILSQPWVKDVKIEVNTADFDENGMFKRLVRGKYGV